MSIDQDARIARTEALFRNVNERIAESAERFGSDEAEFVCECHDQACVDRVEVPLADYEAVRENAARFILLPGHENERVERIVEQRARYRIVEKVNRTIAAMVRRLNPRTEPA
jgi:hypothetical protein